MSNRRRDPQTPPRQEQGEASAASMEQARRGTERA
jgi:hypothetical protein